MPPFENDSTRFTLFHDLLESTWEIDKGNQSFTFTMFWYIEPFTLDRNNFSERASVKVVRAFLGDAPLITILS